MKKFWIIFFSFIISQTLFSSWEKDYLQGLKKFEKKDYFEAIKLFEKAIKEKPSSCDKCIREGMFFYDYYPHFYLAKCYLALKDDENLKKAIDFLREEGKIQKNAKLGKEFQILAQSIPEEEKFPERIAEKKEEPRIEKKEEKVPEQKEIKPPEKPIEKPKEEKIETPKPQPFPKIFQEIEILETQCDKLELNNYPKLEKRKMELSGELIFLKKNWKEARNETERIAIKGKAENLKNKFEKLIQAYDGAQRVENLKKRISERIKFLEKNREKVSKEEWNKIERIRKLLIREREDLNPPEMETSLKELEGIKILEKKEFKNLKMAYVLYFEGKFKEAETKLKNIPQEEKESPYFDLLFSLLNLTEYYLKEKEDKNLLSQAKISFLKAREKGLQKEEINKLPISPKILDILNNF